MIARNLEEYHDIAATTKIRGEGIGFAGMGVKLSLLVAEEVTAETERGSFLRSAIRTDTNQISLFSFRLR
ncbi:MAG: hypothetical protein ACE5OR_12435 [bacterium]